jgi:D-tyrosyl-tRNA(Tyr) deacylase
MIHILGVNHLGVVLYTFYLNTGYREFEKASRNDHLNGENYDKPSNFRIAFFSQTNQYVVVPTFTLHVGSSPAAVVQGSGEGPLSVCVCKPVSSTFWLP